MAPNELCPPVAKMLRLVPDPVPNDGFDDASDVAVLGVGILPNPENPAPPEGNPLFVPGLVFEKVRISFFTSPGACDAPPSNPKANLEATVVEDEPPVASGAVVLKENTGGFATSEAAVGARDDVGKTRGAEVGAAGFF